MKNRSRSTVGAVVVAIALCAAACGGGLGYKQAPSGTPVPNSVQLREESFTNMLDVVGGDTLYGTVHATFWTGKLILSDNGNKTLATEQGQFNWFGPNTYAVNDTALGQFTLQENVLQDFLSPYDNVTEYDIHQGGSNGPVIAVSQKIDGAYMAEFNITTRQGDQIARLSRLSGGPTAYSGGDIWQIDDIAPGVVPPSVLIMIAATKSGADDNARQANEKKAQQQQQQP